MQIISDKTALNMLTDHAMNDARTLVVYVKSDLSIFFCLWQMFRAITNKKSAFFYIY